MDQPAPPEPIGSRETAAEIEQAAASWVARQDRGPLSGQEEEELQRWTAADPRRAGAYARAVAINLHFDRAAALGGTFAVNPETVEAPLRRRIMAVAASALIASATGVGLYSFTRPGARPAFTAIETAKGSVRRIGLPEGSRVTLNTMTRIRPELTRSVRGIDLMQGEALFNVAPDPARPFIVHAGHISVRAVGTSFTVRRLGLDAIRLLVTEGIVEVSRGEEILGRIHAGVEFAVDAATTPVITTLDASQIDGALAWRQGRIDLHGYTVAEAVEEFSRYSNIKIKVDDPSIATLHITGIYATNDPEGFAQDVALSLGLKSVRRRNVVAILKP